MLIRQFYVSLRRYIWLFALTAAFCTIVSPQVQAQQAYGNGLYGECGYNQGCETSSMPISTVVPVSPSPENQQTGRAYSVNIVENQVFGQGVYLVRVTPNFPVSQIARVLLLQDGKIVAETISLIGESYELSWDIPPPGKYVLSISLELVDGESLQRKFNVSAASGSGAVGGEVVDHSSNTTTGIVSAGGRSSLFKSVIDAVRGFTKNVIENIPTWVAYGIPYIFLTAISLLAVSLMYQAKNQLQHINFLLSALKRDVQIADEKTTFIMLVSHHLRTPITIIQGTLELALMNNPADSRLLAAQEASAGLHKTSETILADIINDHYLKDIVAPDIEKSKLVLYRSWGLILPVTLSFVLIIAANVLFIAAGKTQIVIPSLVFQAILSVSLLVFIYSLLQRKRQRTVEQGKLMKQRDHQLALDKARNLFIKRTVKEIVPVLEVLKEKAILVKNAKGASAITTALNQLYALIERFELASELEQGKVESDLSKFDLTGVIAGARSSLEDSIQKKQLRVISSKKRVELYQNKSLVNFVVRILFDNAVRYSKEKGTVTLVVEQQSKNATALYIENQGEGIMPDKLNMLFKPFSSSSDIQVYSEQGIGLSLYLSHLIMRYLGGEIVLQSVPNKTTTAVMRLPGDTS